MAVATPSTKTQKSTIARDAVCLNISSGAIVEVKMKLSRSFICKSFISAATTALISAAPFASAQEQTDLRWNEQRFLIESDLAIGKMSLGMTAEPSGNVDGDFVAMMTAHQQGAIDLADAELKYGHNEALRRLARDMIAARAHEISVMHAAIEELAPAHTGNIPKARLSSGTAPSTKGHEK
jgi:predicted outer membrane protein